MFSRGVGGEGPPAFAAVDFGQDDLVVGITDFNMHANLGAGGSKAIGPGIVQLQLVITNNHGFFWDLLDKTFSFRFGDVKVQSVGEREDGEEGQYHCGHGILHLVSEELALMGKDLKATPLGLFLDR